MLHFADKLLINDIWSRKVVSMEIKNENKHKVKQRTKDKSEVNCYPAQYQKVYTVNLG